MKVNVTVKPLNSASFTYSAIAPSTCDAVSDALDYVALFGTCKIMARPA